MDVIAISVIVVLLLLLAIFFAGGVKMLKDKQTVRRGNVVFQNMGFEEFKKH